ncbi:MAG: hypothetical protein SGPRY_007005 [Prymnesium sp.]
MERRSPVPRRAREAISGKNSRAVPSRPSSSPARSARRTAAGGKQPLLPSHRQEDISEDESVGELVAGVAQEGKLSPAEREPCYLALRLWAVNSFDQFSMRAKVAFRVFMIFRPQGEANNLLPKDGSAISSEDSQKWTDALAYALPSIKTKNGKTKSATSEFKRLTDACFLTQDEKAPLLFPKRTPQGFSEEIALCTIFVELPARHRALLTKGEGQAWLRTSQHESSRSNPPPHHSKYRFVCLHNLHVQSEKIFPKPLGKGIFEEPHWPMETALGEWAVIGSGVTTGVSKRNQAEASFFTALALLLTLTAINYSASDKLPTLPYCTALDDFHTSCHSLVLLIIAENVSTPEGAERICEYILIQPPSLELTKLIKSI